MTVVSLFFKNHVWTPGIILEKLLCFLDENCEISVKTDTQLPVCTRPLSHITACFFLKYIFDVKMCNLGCASGSRHAPHFHIELMCAFFCVSLPVTTCDHIDNAVTSLIRY